MTFKSNCTSELSLELLNQSSFLGLIDLIPLISRSCFPTPQTSLRFYTKSIFEEISILLLFSYSKESAYADKILFLSILLAIADTGLPDLPTGNRIQTAHMQPLSRSSSSSTLVTVNGDGNGRSRV